ncbi:MAG: ADP-ribosylglycohydrolase family protein [Labilithrix sp.]|nr:ADP-ribosylglycohydrolase family protein [Labilithrix sp.]MBX3220208.1 ADP-ribosylglycohydrolase family protein [Labilithrix sp.]
MGNENENESRSAPAREDAALGSVLGALVGDAAGAVLEFFGGPIEAADVAHALTMPGGGTWEVAPGQVTDDGELTMSLLAALASDPDAPTERAARHYARWVQSDPFDIGATTAASLGCLRDPERAARAETEGAAAVMTTTARLRCMASKANGSLMRATPLAVWGARRDPAAVLRAVMSDAELSHPNDACVGAAVAYVLAIRHLVNEGGDVRGALARAEEALGADRFAEPRRWLDEARAGFEVAYTPQDGFVRIGFTHAFRHLALGTGYADALRETLAGGGDTDTNACIVGGLLGARWGKGAIPRGMAEAVLACDTSAGANPRPAELHPRRAPELVRALLDGKTMEENIDGSSSRGRQ